MPDWQSLVRARLAAMPDGPDDDVADEIAQHAEVLYERVRAEGASEADAATAVERELADLCALARARRTSPRRHVTAPEPPRPGGFQAVRAFAADVVHGARVLASRRGFTAAAVMTLALGIGANTAIFSVVNALLLAPLPFADPDRLVMLWEADADDLTRTFIVSAANWEDWREQSTTLSDFAIWEHMSFNVSGGPEPEQVAGLRVSSTAFALFGVPPQLGRTFSAEEDLPGHRVAVISDALWRRRFNANPSIVGQAMRINGETYEIVGVMPDGFRFTHVRHAVWTPIQFDDQDRQRGSHSFQAAARLAPGVTFQAARAEMNAIGRRLAERHPVDNGGEGATITRMRDHAVQPLQPTLVALLGAVGFVLLIACVNVANLTLAQTASRQREFAIRAALGAARSRLASQLLAEGLLLAVLGGAAGILLAWAGTAALAGSLPPAIRFAPFRNVGPVSLDLRVLAFTSTLALLTGGLFSLAPMLGAARVHPGATLKAAGDRGGTGRMTLVRHALVAAEVALAVIVLFGAGLMIKSVARLTAVDPGLDRRSVLLMDLALPQENSYGPPERPTFCADLQREVSRLPGVRMVGAISHLPLSGANAGRGLTLEGLVRPDDGWGASYRITCPGYFAALGIPILRGRDFTDQDATTAPGVVIINDEMARAYYGDQDPIGRRLKLGRPESKTPWLTVVGVTADVRHFGLDSAVGREMFVPYSQAVWPSMTVAVKTAVPPMSLAPAVKSALARVDPDQPVSRVGTMEMVIGDSIGGRRFPMLLLTLFSAIAIVLAAIGVYGVVSYVVSQRTREMGIRLALGARGREVIAMVVAGSIRPVIAGLVLGTAGAFAAARLLTTLLYAVEPTDPGVLAGIVALLGVTAAAACWMPARRAAGVDPLIALREE
ncbi:MAG TPA: ABC transporter permease [Vicinamibacterales bacterium]|nr:ABC transporter permease [Vicinamibacterales bacterium]